MALSKNFSVNKRYLLEGDFEQTLDVPEVVNNAYIKIMRVDGDKNRVFASVTVYASDRQTFAKQLKYSFVPSVTDGSKNFIAQGYDYLKTLDEFKDAEDC